MQCCVFCLCWHQTYYTESYRKWVNKCKIGNVANILKCVVIQNIMTFRNSKKDGKNID